MASLVTHRGTAAHTRADRPSLVLDGTGVPVPVLHYGILPAGDVVVPKDLLVRGREDRRYLGGSRPRSVFARQGPGGRR